MKKRLTSILAVLLCVLVLTGCGGSSKGTSAYAMDAGAAPEISNEMDAAPAAGNPLSDTSGSQSADLPEGRKWIVTVYLSAETEDLDGLTAQLTQSVSELGGYLEDQNVYNGSTYSSRRYRDASFTIRIPAEDADSFTQAVAGMANVVSKQTSRQDITLSYVATESRVNALQTEETRLLELLAQAETMSDLLEIESRLTDVRCELEEVSSQLRLYNNQVDYATIYLDVSEVQEFTPVEPTVWERISGGFTNSLRGVKDGAVDLAVWIIASSPYLVLLALAVGIVVTLGKRLRRRSRKQPPKDAK